MIDATTRARWRAIFAQRTVGPWAQDPPGGTLVVVPQYAKRGICAATHENDAAFIAQAWEGWPAALDALEQAEREAKDARVAVELKDNELNEEAMDSAKMMLAARDSIDALTTVNAKVRDAARLADAEAERYHVELLKLRPLALAIRAWAKDRHTPKLLAALAAYDAP